MGTEEVQFDAGFIAGFITGAAKQPEQYKDVRKLAAHLLRNATASEVAEVASLLPDELKRYLPLRAV